MRIFIQRVAHAQVVVDGDIVGQIGQGLLVLLGFTHNDTEQDISWAVKKVCQLRVFNDEAGKMNLSVRDVGGELLLVSQFTLFADCAKGNRPSYTRSAPPSIAIPLYEQSVSAFREAMKGGVATGIFGADMKVSLLNDGPVSMLLDSQQQNI